jgi:hypothetical protein
LLLKIHEVPAATLAFVMAKWEEAAQVFTQCGQAISAGLQNKMQTVY